MCMKIGDWLPSLGTRHGHGGFVSLVWTLDIIGFTELVMVQCVLPQNGDFRDLSFIKSRGGWGIYRGGDH